MIIANWQRQRTLTWEQSFLQVLRASVQLTIIGTETLYSPLDVHRKQDGCGYPNAQSKRPARPRSRSGYRQCKPWLQVSENATITCARLDLLMVRPELHGVDCANVVLKMEVKRLQ